MQNHFRRTTHIVATALCAVSLALCAGQSSVRADSTARTLSKFASGDGNIIYLGAAVGLPLLRDGRLGMVHTLRAADGMGSALVIAEGLKYLVKEQRPNHADHESFPSGHATAAFAAAAAEAQFHPHEALFWYLGAAAIGQSRVRLQAHYEHDVLAGALLGWGMMRLELASPKGFILAPFIEPAQHAAGLTLTVPI